MRVTVSDEPSNPPGRVKKHSRESGVVLVDNTAPTVEALKVNGRRVSGWSRHRSGGGARSPPRTQY